MACQLLTGGHLWHFDKVCFRPKAADGHCPVSGNPVSTQGRADRSCLAQAGNDKWGQVSGHLT